MTATEAPAPIAPLQLYAQVSEEGEVESVIPIRWCVSPALVETLKERNVEDAHVLLVTFHDGKEVNRKVAPLVAEMTYLSFAYAGANDVHAVVVWGKPRSLMEMSAGHYNYAVADLDGVLYDTSMWSVSTQTQRLVGEDVLSIQVPEAMFAKEPPAWLMKFGSLIWGEPREQCDLRRQVLVNLIALPVLGTAILVASIGSILISAVILIGCLFLGFRGVEFSPLWRPWKLGPAYNVDLVIDNDGSSIWIHKRDPKDGSFYLPSEHFRAPIFFVLNPPAIAVAIVIGLIVNAIFHLHWAWFKTVLVALVVPTILAAIALVLRAAIVSYIENSAAARKRREVEKKKADREDYLKALEAMACNGYRDPKLSALKSEKRTIRLRATALKSQVCRPYAKK